MIASVSRKGGLAIFFGDKDLHFVLISWQSAQEIRRLYVLVKFRLHVMMGDRHVENFEVVSSEHESYGRSCSPARYRTIREGKTRLRS